MKSACRYSCTIKFEIMESSVKLSGGGLTPLHVTAGAGYILHIIWNWRTESEDLAKIIQICYTWAASNARVTFPLFKLPKKLIPHVQGTIINYIHKFLSDIEQISWIETDDDSTRYFLFMGRTMTWAQGGTALHLLAASSVATTT